MDVLHSGYTEKLGWLGNLLCGHEYFEPVDSEKIEIHSVKSRLSPKAEQLGFGVLCCWWKGWLDSFSTSLVPCRFALTARLRAVLQHLQLQEAAAMPTTACLAPQICEKSPKGLRRAMHWETVTLEPLGAGLQSEFISKHLNDCCMTRSSCTQRWPERLGLGFYDPGWELLYGFLNFPEEDGILQELIPLTVLFFFHYCFFVFTHARCSAEVWQPRQNWWTCVREYE